MNIIYIYTGLCYVIYHIDCFSQCFVLCKFRIPVCEAATIALSLFLGLEDGTHWKKHGPFGKAPVVQLHSFSEREVAVCAVLGSKKTKNEYRIPTPGLRYLAQALPSGLYGKIFVLAVRGPCGPSVAQAPHLPLPSARSLRVSEIRWVFACSVPRSHVTHWMPLGD